MRASGELADPFTPPSLCLSMAAILLWDLGLRLPNDNEPPAVNIKPVKLLANCQFNWGRPYRVQSSIGISAIDFAY